MAEVAVYPIKNRKSAFKNFTYLIKEEKTSEAVIVDPAGNLRQLLAKIGDTGSDIKAVLLTHYHDDHINLAGSISQKYHMPVYMCKSEVDAYGFRCKNLEAIENEFFLHVQIFM
ncbi:MAG: MBL fold metallo-hydrolase [Thermodesulfobacteriota bacterium]